MPDQIADHLGKSLADLVAESQALRGDIHNAEQARRRASRVNLGLTMLLVAFVVALLAVGWQNNRLSHQVAATNATLADCTVTGGKCYEEGKARTGAQPEVGGLCRRPAGRVQPAGGHPHSGPGAVAEPVALNLKTYRSTHRLASARRWVFSASERGKEVRPWFS
jgi:hypothetical protein